MKSIHHTRKGAGLIAWALQGRPPSKHAAEVNLGLFLPSDALDTVTRTNRSKHPARRGRCVLQLRCMYDTHINMTSRDREATLVQAWCTDETHVLLLPEALGRPCPWLRLQDTSN